MGIFQVAMALFAMFMVYVLRIHFRKHRLSRGEFTGWILVWGGFIYLSLSPASIQNVANILHIGRIFDLLVIGTFLILSVVVIFTRLQVLEIRAQLHRIIREHAILTERHQVLLKKMKKSRVK